MTQRGKTANTNMQAIVKESFKDLLADEEFINKISKKVAQEIETRLSQLEEKVSFLEDEYYLLKNKLIDMEQYSRRNNVRIFGISEQKNEESLPMVIQFFQEKLNLNYQPADFVTCHRIGENRDGKRPLFIKFTHHQKKTDVMQARKKLKGSKITLVEDLTKERYELYKKAWMRFGKNLVWTSNGNIMVNAANKIHVLKNDGDLDNENFH